MTQARDSREDRLGNRPSGPGGLVLGPVCPVRVAGPEGCTRGPGIAAIARAKGGFGRKLGHEKVVEKRSNEGAPSRRLDRVIDPLRFASGAHQTCVAQPAQVIGDERLGEPDLFDQLTDT